MTFEKCGTAPILHEGNKVVDWLAHWAIDEGDVKCYENISAW